MNTKKRFLIFTLIVLLIPILFLTLNSYAAKVETEMLVKDFPISFPVSYGSSLKVIEDVGLNLKLFTPNKLDISIVDEYIGSILQKNVVNIIDKSDKNGTRFNIKIIPLLVDKNQITLNILENYLLNFVGIAPKNNQKEFTKNGFEIAQAGYNPFYGDGDNYFRVYSLLRRGDKAWIFTIGYLTDFAKDDSLDFSNSNDSKLFENIVNSFTFIENNKLDNFNKLQLQAIKKEDLDEYHKFNSKFKTTI